jgi:predicted permease
VLLVGAGLLARSFLRATAVDPGFRTRGTVAVTVAFPSPDDTAGARRQRAVVGALAERLRALPGVHAAGAVNRLPVARDDGSSGTFLRQLRPDEVRDFDDFARLSKDPARAGSASYRLATEGYFEAMRIPLVAGRTFAASDGADAPPVAVISASVARARFAGESPLGQLIQFGNMDGDLRPLTVVGVVGDVRDDAVDDAPNPTVYVQARQRNAGWPMTVVLAPAPGARGLDAAATAAAARRAVRELDPTLPVQVRPIEEVFARALADRRYALLLAAAFGASALALAITGLYGVVAYVAAERRRELGVRVALGARGADVRRLVLGRGLAPAAYGLAAGLLGALAGGRLLAAHLYGVRPADPATFVAVALALGAAAAAAAWAPARRAARTDPAAVLRAD